MARDTKQRMIESAAELLRSKGLAAMSFTDITEHSGTPRGVIYHHFPGGKVELASEALTWTGSEVRRHLEELDASTPMGLVEQYLISIRHLLVESMGGSSCAVAAVTIDETSCKGLLGGRAEAVFRSWIEVLQAKFVAKNVESEMALDIATSLVILLQGSHIVTRASGELDSFDRAARTARTGIEILLNSRQ
ncbi:MAG: TetR/AcrR family transcriptional regulator [Acidimicrobiales bacterium]